MLDAYYKFKKIAEKAKSRMDCVASTRNYEPFEEKRARRETRSTEKRDAIKMDSLQFNLCKPHTPDQQKRAGLCLSKGNNISLIKRPDQSTPNMGYGDMFGTNDALLFIVDAEMNNGVIDMGSTLEIFVIKGGCNYDGLFTEFIDGEYDEELDKLRASAIAE